MRAATRSAVLAVCLFLASPGSVRAEEPAGWTTSWAASPVFPVGEDLGGMTIRQVVRLSAGGTRIRVRFTNETGIEPLVIEAARIARPGNAPGSVDAASAGVLLFGGQAKTVVPPGAPMLSDPVAFDAAPLSTVAVSVFVSRSTGPSVTHPFGAQTAFVAPGNQAGMPVLTGGQERFEHFFLSGIEVADDEAARPVLVAFGDSITDGAGSTPNANRRWPDILAERLAARGAGMAVGVANAGIGGNRVLHDRPQDRFGPNALARLDRDVLAQPGARWLVVMEGINDIGHSTQGGLFEQAVSADEIIAGHKQIIARAKAKGLRVFGATLTPFEDTVFPGYFTRDGEAKRLAVNDWIRTSGAFDAVLDFDAVLRDPGRPSRLKAGYDSGDHLHPNDAGYKAMAESIDLTLFE